jgi:hypothetical protein
MPLNFVPFIKFCATRTVLSPGTASSGCGPTLRQLADLFFARHQDYFIMTRNCASTYRDLVPSNSFTVTSDFSSVYQDWQKTSHRDADGT